jgi:hypothetical protein
MKITSMIRLGTNKEGSIDLLAIDSEGSLQRGTIGLWDNKVSWIAIEDRVGNDDEDEEFNEDPARNDPDDDDGLYETPAPTKKGKKAKAKRVR